MPDMYLVTYTTKFKAATPEEAARKAVREMRNATNMKPVLNVSNLITGKYTEIDTYDLED